MINFFRKTRKKLADDNKFFKYSRYAIGEVVLVVVGILIVLQINNWNENRKDRKIELEVLQNMAECLETNIRKLESQLALSEKSETSSEIIISVLDKSLPYHDSRAILSYEALKNVGLEIIRN
jgi:hypothetical protein